MQNNKLYRRYKPIEDIYGYNEEMLSEFLQSENSIDSFIELSEHIHQHIEEGSISYGVLSREGELNVHLVNVAVLNGLVGEYVGLDREIVNTLILGGLLHDIGKMFVPRDILNKPGRLTPFETVSVDAHARIGRDIIKLVHESKDISNIVGNHHNYIKHLKEPVYLYGMDKDDKRLLPLICSVSDITDAVVSERPYKKRLSSTVARNDLRVKGIMDVDNIFTFIKI